MILLWNCIENKVWFGLVRFLYSMAYKAIENQEEKIYWSGVMLIYRSEMKSHTTNVKVFLIT